MCECVYVGRCVHLQAIIHDFQGTKLPNCDTDTHKRALLYLQTAAKPKAELYLWHQLVKSKVSQAIVSLRIYGQYSIETSINGIMLKRWVSRSNFKSQIESLFKLQTSMVCQLSWGYCSIWASKTHPPATHNYCSIVTHGQDYRTWSWIAG